MLRGELLAAAEDAQHSARAHGESKRLVAGLFDPLNRRRLSPEQEAWIEANAPPRELKFGRFEILCDEGAGGYGMVYRARDTVSRTIVALKVAHREQADHELRERLRREGCRLLELPQDRRLSRVIAIGIDDEEPWIASEFIHGCTLSDWMEAKKKETGRVPPGEAVHLVIEVALALGEVHRRGLVHRDVTPRNIMVRRDGSPVLIDFGLAKRFSRTPLGPTESRTGEVVGTVGYMAPEQLHREEGEITPRTDVWALGTLLSHLLAGRLPVHGEVSEVSQDRGLPLRVDVLIRQCHRKQKDRYADGIEFAEALRDAMSIPEAPLSRPPREGRRNAVRPARVADRSQPAIQDGSVVDFVEASNANQLPSRGEMLGCTFVLALLLSLVLWIFMPLVRGLGIAGGLFLVALAGLLGTRRGRAKSVVSSLAVSAVVGIVLWRSCSSLTALATAGGAWLLVTVLILASKE